jgi:hypothetical protein
MKFDPSLTEQEWASLLTVEADRTWGQERSPLLGSALSDLARAIQRVVNVPVDSQEELYLLNAQPLSLEDL